MYVLSSGACNLPNSASPMSPDAIRRQDARIAAVGRKFTDGTGALYDLITQLGGSLPGDASGNAGVPTLGTGPLVSNPGGPSAGTPMGPGGVPWVFVPRRGGYARRCTAPRVVPLVSGLYPGAPPSVPVAAPPPRPIAAPPPVVLAPPPPVPPGPSQSSCRTGNVCLDLMNGCVRSDQVDMSQLLACAQAGYVGNRNLYPAILAQPNLPFLGSPMPNPPPYHPGMGDAGSVLTGGPGSGVFWGSLGLLGFTVWALSGDRSPKRR